MSLKAISAGYREISLLRDIMFPTFKTILYEKKEEKNTKDSVSTDTNSSQRAVILMNNLLALVNLQTPSC